MFRPFEFKATKLVKTTKIQYEHKMDENISMEGKQSDIFQHLNDNDWRKEI